MVDQTVPRTARNRYRHVRITVPNPGDSLRRRIEVIVATIDENPDLRFVRALVFERKRTRSRSSSRTVMHIYAYRKKSAPETRWWLRCFDLERVPDVSVENASHRLVPDESLDSTPIWKTFGGTNLHRGVSRSLHDLRKQAHEKGYATAWTASKTAIETFLETYERTRTDEREEEEQHRTRTFGSHLIC